mgnify:CR=1 FL=1
MKKYLVLTVGGSCEPLVTSINQIEPNHTVFVCSEKSVSMIKGVGKVCISSSPPPPPPDLPNIPTQAGLDQGAYETVVLDSPDDLDACYKTILDTIKSIRTEDNDAEIIVDYTGGTKTMTAAAVLAALSIEGVELKVVTGQRTDLRQVVSGTQVLTAVRRMYIDFERVKSECNKMLERYEYASAESILEDFLAESTIDASIERKVTDWVSICRGFDAWDRFDHARARDLLGRKVPGEYLYFLGGIASSSEKKAWETKAGYLLVKDLMANAERRAAQGRYDDAIGRHYRAAELVVQTYLFNTFGISTSKVPADKLPDDLKHKANSDGIAKLGLCDAWRLAEHLDQDLVGWYKDWKEKIKGAVNMRNKSLFAHGSTPISKADYNNDTEKGIAAFVRAAMDYFESRGIWGKIVELPPFPTKLPE